MYSKVLAGEAAGTPVPIEAGALLALLASVPAPWSPVPFEPRWYGKV
jgi:hypothetical protein